MSVIVLLGAPGAGCSSVATAWAQARGGVVADLGRQVAEELGVPEGLALVSIGEERYREVETSTAVSLLTQAGQAARAAAESDQQTPGLALALGSGCLGREEVLAALEEARRAGAVVVALTASVRRLASRNGLDAPRSVALGNVNHAFALMARAREARCRELAGVVVDTTDTTPEQAAGALPGFPAPEVTR